MKSKKNKNQKKKSKIKSKNGGSNNRESNNMPRSIWRRQVQSELRNTGFNLPTRPELELIRNPASPNLLTRSQITHSPISPNSIPPELELTRSEASPDLLSDNHFNGLFKNKPIRAWPKGPGESNTSNINANDTPNNIDIEHLTEIFENIQEKKIRSAKRRRNPRKKNY